MKTLHAKCVKTGDKLCAVQMRKQNKRSCEAAQNYTTELESDGYALIYSYGGPYVWNFIYQQKKQR